MPEPLSLDAVRHVARLARLHVDERHLEEYRTQLSSVLEHIAMISRLDLDGVEPMAHPLDVTNRLAEDREGPVLSVDAVLANAPATEDRYLAVPKVLDM